MDMCDEAVSRALEIEDKFFALMHAEKAGSEIEQRKLLLKIAVHYIQKGEDYIEEVISLTESYPLLKIEDLLLHFDESLALSDVINSVCKGLKMKSAEIDSNRNAIKLYSAGADKLKLDLLRVNVSHHLQVDKVCIEC